MHVCKFMVMNITICVVESHSYKQELFYAHFILATTIAKVMEMTMYMYIYIYIHSGISVYM